MPENLDLCINCHEQPMQDEDLFCAKCVGKLSHDDLASIEWSYMQKLFAESVIRNRPEGVNPMPCDTRLKRNQTISQRKEEVKRVVDRLQQRLAAGSVKAVVGQQGAIAFTGLSALERDGVTDACIYRRIMSSGSALAKLAIQKAELLAGRQVNKQAVAMGVHSHDGGHHWHDHKG